MNPIEEKLKEIKARSESVTNFFDDDEAICQILDHDVPQLIQALRFALRHWGPNIEKDILDILDGKVKK